VSKWMINKAILFWNVSLHLISRTYSDDSIRIIFHCSIITWYHKLHENNFFWHRWHHNTTTTERHKWFTVNACISAIFSFLLIEFCMNIPSFHVIIVLYRIFRQTSNEKHDIFFINYLTNHKSWKLGQN